MKEKGKIFLRTSVVLMLLFIVFTIAVKNIDLQPVGVNRTVIGFAAVNTRFHKFTGYHPVMYTSTDWLGIVPFVICFISAAEGFVQLLKRRSFFKVDSDIVVLGLYYIAVLSVYAAFEMWPVNYRPVLINGVMEASYPSSTTLMVLTVIPVFAERINRRYTTGKAKAAVNCISAVFSVFMVTGRLISGVHWITDIFGGIILSAGLFCIYKYVITLCCNKEKRIRR